VGMYVSPDIDETQLRAHADVYEVIARMIDQSIFLSMGGMLCRLMRNGGGVWNDRMVSTLSSYVSDKNYLGASAHQAREWAGLSRDTALQAEFDDPIRPIWPGRSARVD